MIPKLPTNERFETVQEAVAIFNAQHDGPVTLGQALRVVALYLEESHAPAIVFNCWNLVGMSASQSQHKRDNNG